MSDFVKSAMNYLNTNPNNISICGASINTNSTSSNEDNEFCGRLVEVADYELRIKRVIAEGGFAYVYVAQDLQTGKNFALKRLIGVDKEGCKNIINEINIHKQISGHANIVSFIGSTALHKDRPLQSTEYLLLLELCTGTLNDYLNNALCPSEVLKIFYQAASAVAHMHSQMPPVVHRDIKIENFLVSGDKQLKLCDFGSATTDILTPTPEWNAQQRNILEDQLMSITTPKYRAPEVLDTWSNYEIGHKVDIWSLGCILYVLCFRKHPFDDSAKLRIINGNFIIPPHNRYSCFNEIIKGCLTVNPLNRFDILMVLDKLAYLGKQKNWSLDGQIDRKCEPMETSMHHINIQYTDCNSTFYLDSTTTTNASTSPNNKSATLQTREVISSSINNYNNTGLLSTLRDGAGNFLKNLKDASSKVVQTMHQAIARADLDISYITSRVLVMPCPSEGFESTYKTNNIEDVRLFLDSQFFSQQISIYNFGPKTCPRLPPPIRTVEMSNIYDFRQARAPSLKVLIMVAEDMFSFLAADSKSIVVIQNIESTGSISAMAVSALLLYSNFTIKPEEAMQVFAIKCHPINLRPSELRYLHYLADLLRPIPLSTHNKFINLVSLSCQPIPRMTKARDGCRLYIEVHCNDSLLISTLQDYEKMQFYRADAGNITLPINVNVCGDVTIVLYHARKGMLRSQGVKLCQFQFHTGFVPEQETLMSFSYKDLDDCEDLQYVCTTFVVYLSLTISEEENPTHKNMATWLPNLPRHTLNIFSTPLEYEEMVHNFVCKANHHLHSKITKIDGKATISPTTLPDITDVHINQNFTAQNVEPTPPIDLLNLNQLPILEEVQKTSEITMRTTDASFDLLGAFGDDDSSGIGTASVPDILENKTQSPKSAADLEDIFGSSDYIPAHTPYLDLDELTGSTTHQVRDNQMDISCSFSNKIPKNIPPPKTKDVFDDIADMASELNIKFNPNTLSSGTSASSCRTSFGSSSYTTHTSNQLHNTFQNQVGISVSQSQMKISQPINFMPFRSTQVPVTTSHPTSTTWPSITINSGYSSSPMQRPDYRRANFEPTKQQSTLNSQSPKTSDIFADILGEQGYTFSNKTSQGLRSINDMRKCDLNKEERNKEPNKVKIMEWTDGKKNNIRALLCSMHTILWPEAKWTKYEMSQLITSLDVKKAYRKACLAVHPDKHNNTENEDIAKLIFMELSNAWTDFENDLTQQNMFQ